MADYILCLMPFDTHSFWFLGIQIIIVIKLTWMLSLDHTLKQNFIILTSIGTQGHFFLREYII